PLYAMEASKRGSLFCQNIIGSYLTTVSAATEFVIGMPLDFKYACTRFQVGWFDPLGPSVSESGRVIASVLVPTSLAALYFLTNNTSALSSTVKIFAYAGN